MGRRSGTASKALVRRRIRPGGGEGWRNRPPAAWPKGNAAGGFGPDAEGMVDMPAGRCFGDLFLRAGKGLRTTRRMPGASCPSSNVWRWYGRSGFTPKRAPIPALRGHAFGRRDHFGQAMGWLARKRYSRGGPGPRGMVWLVLRSIQGWRLPALHHAVGPRYSGGGLAGIRSELWGRRCHFTRIRRLKFFPLSLVPTAWSRWSSGLESVGDSQLWPALRFPDRAPATAPPFLAINGPVPEGVGRRAPPGCQRLPDTGQLPAVDVELAVDLVRPGVSVVNGM